MYLLVICKIFFINMSVQINWTFLMMFFVFFIIHYCESFIYSGYKFVFCVVSFFVRYMCYRYFSQSVVDYFLEISFHK